MENKILVLAPNFYGYTKSILEKIRQNGLEVDFFDTRPSVSGFKKAKMRKNAKYNFKIFKQFLFSIFKLFHWIAYENNKFTIFNIYFNKDS